MITVRTLRADEWELGRDLRLAALAGSPPGTYASTVELSSQFTEEQWRQWVGRRELSVAELDGVSVGMAGALLDDDGIPVVVSVWVDPAARGSGAVDGLLAAVIDWARAGHHHEVRLWVMNGNDRAEAAYRRLGFRRTGREKPCAVGDSRTEAEMRLPLQASTPSA